MADPRSNHALRTAARIRERAPRTVETPLRILPQARALLVESPWDKKQQSKRRGDSLKPNYDSPPQILRPGLRCPDKADSAYTRTAQSSPAPRASANSSQPSRVAQVRKSPDPPPQRSKPAAAAQTRRPPRPPDTPCAHAIESRNRLRRSRRKSQAPFDGCNHLFDGDSKHRR